MRRWVVFAGLLCLAGSLGAQSNLFPSAWGGLNAAESSTIPAAQLERTFAEHAVLRELGAQSAEQRTYRQDAHAVVVTALIFRDPTGAYGGFQLLSTPEMTPSNLAELGSISNQRALFAISNVLVQIEGAELNTRAGEIAPLLAALQPLAKKEAGPFPNLSQYLPQGQLPGSQRFLLGPAGLERLLPSGKGDWLGFDLGAEAQAARYRIAGREATLLLVNYPTPQVAIAKEKALSRWFNVNQAEEVVLGRPVIFTRRMTSLLAILTEVPTRKDSEALLAKVNYQTELTWNEPGHLATDPPWAQTVANIVVGTFYFVGFGLAVGLAFALFRLGIKKLLPGKVFDRAEKVEILQLGIDSKPIEGKDFYQ